MRYETFELMSEDRGEIPANIPDSKPEIVRPLSKEKSEKITQALGCFDRVSNSARRLGFMDQQFADRARSALKYTLGDVENSNLREPGIRESRQLADNLAGFLRPKLLQITQEGESLGLGTESVRAQVEELLQKAALEDDPIKAFSFSSQASELFSRFSDRLIQKRQEQGRREQEVDKTSAENAQRSGVIFHRVSELLRVRLEGGVLDRYRLKSTGLLNTVNQAVQSLSSEDKKFLVETGREKALFNQVVSTLISSNPGST